MVGAFAVLMVVTVLIVPVWIYERSHNGWYWWDYCVPLWSLLLWVALVRVGVGQAGLGNVVEGLYVLLAAVVLSYLRLAMAVAVPSKVSAKLRSVLVASLLVGFVVALRLVMPPLSM